MTPRLNTIWASATSVAKDWVEAYKWLLLAARQGDENAKALMTVMESKLLTSEQIAQEQKRARRKGLRYSSYSLSKEKVALGKRRRNLSWSLIFK